MIMCFVVLLLLLLSFVGYGRTLLLFTSPSRIIEGRDSGWGYASFLGVSLVILLGGPLNFLGIVSKNTNFALIGIGVLLSFVTGAFRESFRPKFQSKAAWVVSVLGILLISVFVISYIRGARISLADDYNGYLVWPYKMLQTGSIGADPFSTRRFSSLGGNSFLQSIALSFVSLIHINLIEPILAMVMLVLLFWDRIRSTQAPALYLLAVFLGLSFTFAFFPNGNTTSILLSFGFIFLLFTQFYEHSLDESSVQMGIRWAIVCAALSSLKATVTYFSFFWLGSLFFTRFIRVRHSGKSLWPEIRMACVTFITYALVIFPWLAVARPSIGSWFYPILGKGHHTTAYGEYVDGLLKANIDIKSIYSAIANTTRSPGFFATIVGLIGLMIRKSTARTLFLYWAWVVVAFVLADHAWVKAQMLVLFLGVALFFIRGWKIVDVPLKWFCVSVSSAWLCATLFYLALNGAIYQRYCFPMSCGAFLAVLWIGMEYASSLQRRWHLIAVSLAMVFLAFSEINPDVRPANVLLHPSLFVRELTKHLTHIRIGALDDSGGYDPVVPGEPDWKHAKLQESVPQGETILARTFTPYLFNFARNNILVIDNPGEVSLPPGIPFRKGPENVAEYLRKVGICYVAFTYKPLAGWGFEHYYLLQHYYSWVRAQGHLGVDFTDNIRELGKRYPLVFDDGSDQMIHVCGKPKVTGD